MRRKTTCHKTKIFKLFLFTLSFLILSIGMAPFVQQAAAAAPSSWPGSGEWLLSTSDFDNCGGTGNDFRDVVNTFYYYDEVEDFLFLRLENVGPAGWDGTVLDPGRYKWFFDTDGRTGGILATWSGNIVEDAEFGLFVDDLPHPGGDGLGTLSLFVFGTWPPSLPAVGPLNGTGTALLGGPQGIATDDDIGYRVDGVYVDMYVSMTALGGVAIADVSLLWATDLENTNWPQAPHCDSPDGGFQPVVPGCGDGTVDTGEECDDGNTDDLDACGNDCVLNVCGDGTLDTGEACDDGNGIDNDGCNNACEITVDLSVDLSVTITPVSVGDNVTFTVELSNQGPSPPEATGTGIELTVLLPPGYTYVSDTPSVGSYDSGTGVWIVGFLPFDSTETLVLTATVNASGPYDVEAEVTSADQPDPDSTPDNDVLAEDDQDNASVTPQSEAIPTLNEWGMIILSLLLFGYSVWVMRRRKEQNM